MKRIRIYGTIGLALTALILSGCKPTPQYFEAHHPEYKIESLIPGYSDRAIMIQVSNEVPEVVYCLFDDYNIKQVYESISLDDLIDTVQNTGEFIAKAKAISVRTKLSWNIDDYRILYLTDDWKLKFVRDNNTDSGENAVVANLKPYVEEYLKNKIGCSESIPSTSSVERKAEETKDVLTDMIAKAKELELKADLERRQAEADRMKAEMETTPTKANIFFEDFDTFFVESMRK